MAVMVRIHDVCDGHVGWNIGCVDRIHLNSDVPHL
ncbi:hypothetical protein MLPF_2248 [Mycobacterium lepromatosis]|nr:hypothetical protein MLPF_2248 [Mycobacterium lepromatosis]